MHIFHLFELHHFILRVPCLCNVKMHFQHMFLSFSNTAGAGNVRRFASCGSMHSAWRSANCGGQRAFYAIGTKQGRHHQLHRETSNASSKKDLKGSAPTWGWQYRFEPGVSRSHFYHSKELLETIRVKQSLQFRL